ncbi:MAG: isoprenylcysteine carboxylmethyltransferase family protein [Chloroflexota bacterium]|nr:MAG: isoprenylcysteine carboxylmethyltransferase family protein [Chloroflexota bacterium]
MLIIKLVILVVLSVGIFIVSWQSLRNPRSHGFYRFFAFESILVLILLNLEHWFTDPFSVKQIVSWFLLLCSAVLVVHGFYLLHAIGRPRSGIEDTTTLVMVGAYKYIRHPLYSSLLFFAWGVFFKNPSWLGGVLAIVASAFLVATAKVEELENIRNFGADYRIYMNKTKMFIPFLF